MGRFKHINTLYLLVFIVIASFGFVGCGEDSVGGLVIDNLLKKDTDSLAGFQAETFPGLVQEEWFFFNPDKSFHHFEIFTYQYDESGRRTRGDFFHSETGISLVLTYDYDSEGRLIGEHWVNPDFPVVFWDITYLYDETNTRILSGLGTGFYDWEFTYGYDEQERRISTAFTSDDPLAPRFTLYHQYNDQGQSILATGTEQRGLSIVIVYTY
jgi:hypothetical protein